MNDQEMYLIHEDDYLSHINDKVRLYSMLRQLTYMIGKGGGKDLTTLAGRFQKVNEELFRSWGIPASYLVTGDEDDLADLMDAELSAPEDAGYVRCDGDCCPCDGDELCCEYAERVEREFAAGKDSAEADTEDADAGDDMTELLDALAEAARSLLGDSVTIRIRFD